MNPKRGDDAMIQLGDRAKDRISGFEGIVIGIGQWLHGCRRISIQPTELRDVSGSELPNGHHVGSRFFPDARPRCN